MDQYNNYIFYGLIVGGLSFFAVFAFKLFTYLKQLKKAYLQLGMEWPFPSQKELHAKLEKDAVSTVYSVYTTPFRGLRVIFMRTDNPILKRPLSGIRRCFLAFFLFPIFLVLILIVVAGFSMTP